MCCQRRGGGTYSGNHSATTIRLMRYAHLLLLLSSLFTAGLRAQVDVEGALNAAFKKADFLTAVAPVQWRPGLNLLAGITTIEEPLPITLQLTVGVPYTFIGTATTEAVHLDLRLYDTDGSALIAADTLDDATPILEFTPPRSGAYTLQLSPRAANDSTLTVALALLQRGGVDLPDREYALTAEGFFGSSKVIRQATEALGWARGKNGWCVLGGLPTDDQQLDLSLEGMRLRRAEYTLAASSLNHLATLDLYLVNQDGSVAAAAGAATAYPLLNYIVQQPATYDIYLSGGQTRESAFTLLGIYQREF